MEAFKNEYQEEKQKEKQLLDRKDNLEFLISVTFKTIHTNHIRHCNYLTSLLNFISIEHLLGKLHLLYRATEHNFNSSKFHQLCNGKGKTLVLVRSKLKNIFGGYSTTPWFSSNIGVYSFAPGSFLFSLDKQTKHTIINQNEGNAIYGYNNLGPTFGGGKDLNLYNNCQSTNENYANLGHTYSLPNNISYDTNDSKSYLAGSCKFEVEEYEVFLVS